MSIMKQGYWYLGIGILLSTGYASAQCVRTPTATYEFNMEMGRIVVDPDLPKWSVIAQKTYTMTDPQRKSYATCYAGTTYLDAEVIMPGLTLIPNSNKVYQTNVPGIGMRFERGGGSVRFTYPASYPVSGSGRPGWGGTSVYLADSVFTLQLIKTADKTGAGSIASGKYTRYGFDKSNPVLVSYLNADAITISSASCKVRGDREKNIPLEPVNRTQFTRIGSTAGEKNFDLTLMCDGGVSVSGYTNVAITFDGTEPQGLAGKGVLVNLSTSSPAKGIGIQVLERDSRKELIFKKKYGLGRIFNNKQSEINLNYTARYYQYAGKISAGEVRSQMVFNITYD
ncbi:fimbrial protein [Providencia sp. Me31A]|uniref:fimbrial protein n=1 Tax=Providencia sp. Me31A TaxID=3392637 RepID=UPI003D2B2926